MTRNVIVAAVNRAHEDEKRERLNLAAPDLLAALKEAEPLLRFMVRQENRNAMDVLPKAQAAIAKAEGRS